MRKSEIILLAFLLAPAPLCAGINVWTSHGPSGGSIRALAIDPKNSSTVYVVTDSGGVFKSTDGGAGWNAASSGLMAGSVYGLAIDPENPSTLYGWGGGLFRSTDGGASWSAINSGGLVLGVGTLALDPQNPTTVYAGSGNGVFKSTDGGASWAPANSGLQGLGVSTLALDPRDPTTVYAGVFYRNGTGSGGVFKSTDSGASWSAPLEQKLIELSDSATQTCDGWGAYFGRIMGRAAPFPEDISCSPDGSRDFRITAGQYVADLQNFAARRPNGADFGLIVGANTLVVDPRSPSTLYAVNFRGIFKSTDGGVSWNAANSGLLDNFTVRTIAIDPGNPGTLYASTYRGVFKSTDDAASWNAAWLPNAGGGPLAIDPQNTRTVYAGTFSGLFKSKDAAESWSPSYDGIAATNITSLAVDPKNRGTLFRGDRERRGRQEHGWGNELVKHWLVATVRLWRLRSGDRSAKPGHGIRGGRLLQPAASCTLQEHGRGSELANDRTGGVVPPPDH